jgi:hypothetical protein
MSDDLKWALLDTLRLLNSMPLGPTYHDEAERIAGSLGINIAAQRHIYDTQPMRPTLKLKAAG